MEAVMVCVDNSDYTRNGDYMPTRFEAQSDAVNLVCGAKTQQNPENSVGILTTAGDRTEVMLTPTTDLGRMVAELSKIKIGGAADFMRGVQTAQLALKHRQNKNQKQRIIAFVGSPISASVKELETLGKNLKKNNVSLDIVSYGEIEDNREKLEKLLAAVNSNDTSHLCEVVVGSKLLSDVLLTSPIVSAAGEGGGMGGGGGEAGFDFGINPAEDPELAMALRISMEEERARQAQQAAESGAAPPAEGGAAPMEGVTPAAPAAAPPAAAAAPASAAADLGALGMDMDDMDEELKQALLLSLQDADPPAPAAAPAEAEAPKPADTSKDAEMTPADAPAPASGSSASAAAPAASGDAEMSDPTVDAKWFQDRAFVQELLGSLPGVDISDPRIQQALKEVGGNEEQKKEGDGSGGSGGDNKDLS